MKITTFFPLAISTVAHFLDLFFLRKQSSFLLKFNRLQVRKERNDGFELWRDSHRSELTSFLRRQLRGYGDRWEVYSVGLFIFVQCHVYKKPSLFSRPEWKWTDAEKGGSSSIPSDINRFIIVEGTNANKILTTYVITKNKQPLCTSRNTSVFELENRDYLCVAEEQDLSYYAMITELLSEFQKSAKECIIISLQPSSEYRTDKIPDGCIIRGINSALADIPQLLAPNFITGIGAGVASKRAMYGQTFVCYVLHVDIYDQQTVKTVLQHTKKIGLCYDETIRIKPLHHKSDLYM
jgi:hypothetical protein